MLHLLISLCSQSKYGEDLGKKNPNQKNVNVYRNTSPLKRNERSICGAIHHNPFYVLHALEIHASHTSASLVHGISISREYALYPEIYLRHSVSRTGIQ